MIIEPKTRGFICTTAHPDGCAEAVREQIEYVKKPQKPKAQKCFNFRCIYRVWSCLANCGRLFLRCGHFRGHF